jgi:hypothetical protein
MNLEAAMRKKAQENANATPQDTVMADALAEAVQMAAVPAGTPLPTHEAEPSLDSDNSSDSDEEGEIQEEPAEVQLQIGKKRRRGDSPKAMPQLVENGAKPKKKPKKNKKKNKKQKTEAVTIMG